MIAIAIIGACGRMGQALVRCIAGDPSLKLVAAIDHADHPALGEDAGAVADVDSVGVVVSSELSAVAVADVIVDFTLAAAMPANVEAAVRARKPLILGTTGLGDREKTILCDAAQTIPIVCAPNMSLGVNLLFAVVKKAAAALAMDYRVEIDETHHVHKKDAPSGTALRLGEIVADARGQDFRGVMVHEPGKSAEAEFSDAEPVTHPADKIVIHSHREGEVVGHHTVTFANEGETLDFTHHAWSRDALAMGALRAARWAIGRQPGLYDMQDVLGL